MKYVAASIALGLAICCAAPVRPAAVMAVDQDDAYSGKVLDKIVRKWSPPNRNKYEGTLKIMISLDDAGQVLDCKVRQSSGLAGADASACAAIRAAAPFGPPPYGIPTDLYLAFWAGDAPAVKEAPAQSGALELQKARETAQNADNSVPKARYLAKVTHEIRDAIYVPQEASPGTYYVTARVKCDAAGKILSGDVIKGSGSAIVDKYVRQGIRRAGAITPPPKGVGDTLDLTFKLVR